MKAQFFKSLFCFLMIAHTAVAANIANDPVTDSIRRRKNVDVVHYLGKHPEFLNKVNKLGMTPVMVAVSEKNLVSLTGILTLKPDLTIRGFEEQTALEIALDEPDLEIVDALLKAGAPVNDVNPETGSTALHVAVRNQNIELIKLLLRAGADVQIVNKKGDSPLSLAQKGEMRKVYRLLKVSLKPAK